MIKLTQTLSKADYQAAAAVHYRTYRWTRVQPWLGVSMIAACTYMLFESRLHAVPIVGIAYGISLFFRRQQWINRLVKSVATSKQFGKEITFELVDDFFCFSQGEEHGKILLSNLFAYVQSPIGLLLYPQRNLFYCLKAEAFDSKEQMAELIMRLNENGVQELKT